MRKGWVERDGGRMIGSHRNRMGRQMRRDERGQRISGSTMSQLSSQVRFSSVPERELIKYAITPVSKRQPQIEFCTAQH